MGVLENSRVPLAFGERFPDAVQFLELRFATLAHRAVECDIPPTVNRKIA